MPATTYTLTGNIRDALRTDASELQSLQGYLEPSQVAIADTTDNTVSLGNVALGIDPATGAFSAAIVGTGSLVSAWRLILLWRDSSLADSGRALQRFDSGWFTITANVNFANVAQTQFVAVTTAAQSAAAAAASATSAAGSATAAATSASSVNLAALIALNGSLGWALDTDGQPYYDPAIRDRAPVLAWLLDTDGTPYYITAGAQP